MASRTIKCDRHLTMLRLRYVGIKRHIFRLFASYGCWNCITYNLVNWRTFMYTVFLKRSYNCFHQLSLFFLSSNVYARKLKNIQIFVPLFDNTNYYLYKAVHKWYGEIIKYNERKSGGERYKDVLHARRCASALHENGCVRRSILRVYSTFDDFSGSLALSESKAQNASIGICIDCLCAGSDISGKIAFTLLIL